MNIAIFGAGSWGTALSVCLAGAGRSVMLWARRPEAAAMMRQTRHNPSYLPDVEIPPSVHITADLEEVATGSRCWVVATPSQAVRHMAEQLRPHVTEAHVIASLAKGIETGTLMTTTQVLADVLSPPVPETHLGVVYGPSHAEEVAAGTPTTVVAAFHAPEVARHVQEALMTPRLRVYVNPDMRGVEIAGSVKNVLAIAAGISDGVGYGDNAKAALITRGLAEIKRLGRAMGTKAQTFAGLAGIGDLVVTCTSRHSRNRYLGEEIGKGRTLEAIESEMAMVAEGVRTTRSVYALAQRCNVEMPITEAVHAILFEGKEPSEAVDELMTRAAKREIL